MEKSIFKELEELVLAYHREFANVVNDDIPEETLANFLEKYWICEYQ